MIPVKTILSVSSPPVARGPQLTKGILFAGEGHKPLQDQFLRNTPVGESHPNLLPASISLSFRGRQGTEATPGADTQHEQPPGKETAQKGMTNDPVGTDPVGNSAGISRDSVEENIPEIDVLQELNKFYDIFSQAYQDKTQRAEAFSQFLWYQVISPAIAQNPEGLKVAIENWEQNILKEGKPGVIQQSTLALMGFFKNNLDKPEVLKETTRLFSILYFNGGYRKINRLIGLFSTNKFAKASPIEKGKLIVEDLGTLFIKLVQTLSTVPGLFSPEVQASFTPLYQDITPVPFSDIKKLVESELKMPLIEAYQSFDETPINVGSIAQVHKAVLHSGKVVAVKVVKPGVLKSIQEDLEILQPLSKLAQQMFPTVNAEKIFTDLGNQLQQECNMLEEAERLKKIQEHLKIAPDLQAPEVIDSHTTPSVLTMSFMEGKKLLAYQGNGKVASHYLGCVMDQLLSWGVCQAEPHPGNLPYDEAHQRFDFLDAGQVYFPTEHQRLNFSKLLVALYSKNTSLIAENSIEPEAQKANPEGFNAYQKELEAHVQTLSLNQPETIVKTIAQISLLAQKHNLKTVSYHPMSWKTLFTGLMVGLTLDGKMNPGWVLGKKLLYKLFKEDRRFLLRATSQMAISTFRKKFSALQVYVSQGLQFLNPRRLWRST